jgi:hypothetical protein
MTLIITILIDNIFLDAFVLQKDDAIVKSIVTFFFSENLILISSVDAGSSRKYDLPILKPPVKHGLP